VSDFIFPFEYMTCIKNSDKTEKMKKGTSLWYRLNISEEILSIFREEVWTKKKAIDSMHDTISMPQVSIQSFRMWIQDKQKEIGAMWIRNKRQGYVKNVIKTRKKKKDI